MVELPLAQHILAPGLAPSVYTRFNRIRKAVAMAYYLHITHHGHLTGSDINALTQRQMAAAARQAGVEAPNSAATRDTVRELLHVFNATGGSSVPDSPARAVTNRSDRAITRDDLARALDGLGIVVQAAAQGVDR
ncbi:hypothetical protein ACIG3E_32660 [Streptomyces sp. NPDC053474]|uniref:hypothetical protein n=1 Tax=Streptomyces sp. NPDC053474 TaxID=3365704 RepID=UPI0037D2F231